MNEEGYDFTRNENGIWKESYTRVACINCIFWWNQWYAKAALKRASIFLCMRLCNVWEQFRCLNNSLSGVSYGTTSGKETSKSSAQWAPKIPLTAISQAAVLQYFQGVLKSLLFSFDLLSLCSHSWLLGQGAGEPKRWREKKRTRDPWIWS